jgi:hypothetical protein
MLESLSVLSGFFDFESPNKYEELKEKRAYLLKSHFAEFHDKARSLNMTVFQLVRRKTLDDAFQADNVFVLELQKLFQVGHRS